MIGAGSRCGNLPWQHVAWERPQTKIASFTTSSSCAGISEIQIEVILAPASKEVIKL